MSQMTFPSAVLSVRQYEIEYCEYVQPQSLQEWGRGLMCSADPATGQQKLIDLDEERRLYVFAFLSVNPVRCDGVLTPGSFIVASSSIRRFPKRSRQTPLAMSGRDMSSVLLVATTNRVSL